MTVPEPTESSNDRAYCDYLQGSSIGPIGLLLLVVGLGAVYAEIDKIEGDERGCFTRDFEGRKDDRISRVHAAERVFES